MEVDAFTLVAQLFNFAVLVWILRRVLYRPIREAMKAREATIEERLATAAHEKAAAEELADEYRGRLRDIDERRDEMLSEARERADRLGTQLSHALNERIGEREREWHATQGRRAEQELGEFRAAVQKEILDTLRAMLSDLADEDLERRMTESFLARVDELSDDEIARLVGHADDRVKLHVVTTYPLDDEGRTRVASRLSSRFGSDAMLSFEVDASRVAGIELRSQGHVLGWSIGDYLDTLDEAVRHRVEALRRGGDGAAA